MFWTGGSSAANILLGIGRTKLIAIWLGPAGVGLSATYQAVVSLASVAGGMGLGASSVRAIAAARERGREEDLSAEVVFARRTALLLAAAVSLLFLAAASTIGRWTLGASAGAGAFRLLSLAVFGSIAAEMYSSVLRGMRQIKVLSVLGMVGPAVGTILGLPMVWLWKLDGLAPLQAAVALATGGAIWWRCRRLVFSRPVPQLSWSEWTGRLRQRFSLGFSIAASSALSALGVYLLRWVLIRQGGVAAVGLYMAAFTLSGIYVGFILQAMGVDYYPRLSGLADKREQMAAAVSQQMRMALLLATPGILLTLTLSEWVIRLFYSNEFLPAAAVLRWQLLGVLGRVVTWPLGYVLLAVGDWRAFLITEIFTQAAHLGLIFGGYRLFGLKGTGMAFAVLYVLYAAVIIPVTRRHLQHWCAKPTALAIGFSCAAILLQFALTLLCPPAAASVALVAGLILTFAFTLYAGRVILALLTSRAGANPVPGAT